MPRGMQAPGGAPSTHPQNQRSIEARGGNFIVGARSFALLVLAYGIR